MNKGLLFSILVSVMVALPLVVSADGVWAQDSERTPTGTLVVAPQDLDVGERTEAAAFHIYPDDLEVKITYDSAYLAPDGESCAGNTIGSTATATSSLGVVLTACSVGTTYVRLVVADDTEYVISERDVVITEPSGIIGQGVTTPSISLGSIPSSLDVGESDRITVRVTDLDSRLEYELVTVPRNDKAFMFNSRCSDDSQEEDISGKTFYSVRYTIWGCSSPGTNVYSYLNFDGRAITSTGISNNWVKVVPTVNFSARRYSGDEGDDIEITVKLNGAVSESPDVPIEFTNNTAESSDYDVDGLNRDDELEFSRGDNSQSFTIETNHDNSDCTDERLTVSFGSLPSEVSADSPSSATVTIEDDDSGCSVVTPDPQVYYARTAYSVDEGSTIHIKVSVNRGGPRSDVDIPITWSNGQGTVDADYTVHLEPGNTIEIDKGDAYKTFQFDAEEDNDCRDETVTFAFGSRLPSGIDRGNQSSTTVTIEDDDTGCPTGSPAAVNFSASTYSVTEGDNRNIYVSLSKSLSSDVKIPVSWHNGSAEDDDYEVEGLDRLNRLTISGGNTSAYFTVDSAEDNSDCDNETVTFTIGTSLPSGVSRGTTYQTILTITDDEPASDCLPLVSVARSRSSITEGQSVTFWVRTSKLVPTSIYVPLSSTTTGDFFKNTPPSSVTIPANAWNTSFQVETKPDDQDEPHGSVEVRVDSSTAYTTATSSRTAFVRVFDDDNPPTNNPPTVTIDTAGGWVNGGEQVSLDATASDPDNDSLTYSWSGAGTFANASALDTTWTAPGALSTARSYTLTILVSDGSLSATATVDFTVRARYIPPPNNVPSVTIHTPDQTIDGEASITLSVTATDRDGIHTLTYSWSGQGGEFDDNTELEPTWTAPPSELLERKYKLTITVRDNRGATVTDSVTFTVSTLPTPSKPEIHEGLPSAKRGRINLDWHATDNTTNYEVLQLKAGSYEPLTSSEVTIDFDASSAEVRGLDPDAQQIYFFKVKAKNDHGEELSDRYYVHIRPRPQGLGAMYNYGEYGQLTLTWNTVVNPDATYIVEQQFPDGNWYPLPREGVSATTTYPQEGKVQAVVGPLEVALSYKHRVRASSVQGMSEASDVTMTLVRDERPPPPTNLTSIYTKGFTGVRLLWDIEPPGEITGYEIETDPTDEFIEISPVGYHRMNRSATVRRLDLRRYEFKVYSVSAAGRSKDPATIKRDAPEPSSLGGHQADHVAKYDKSKLTSSVMTWGVDVAASKWTAAANFGLEICDDVDVMCDKENSDNGIVTIVTEASTSTNTYIPYCKERRGCVVIDHTGYPSEKRVGSTYVDMKMIIEDPVHDCLDERRSCGNDVKRYVWTDNEAMHGQDYEENGVKVGEYAYVEYILIHEFGHTLGLPDFYEPSGVNWDSRLTTVTAIMKSTMAKGIKVYRDIAQLDALYVRHTPHAPRR